ncbi:hypothetical protein [Streptomyces cylindrosporus]|uniref:Uncharacterized protein n=1 Tax=Streptomyces cylindrosporus TaxID=2927583 RepID=A0ABS9Y4L0_9ACTN|nr:hypothetical protein [Streptomyces cylindrosporus]MCI3271435.1 hypothetical protein [Streptomyces cylindrosporus]
MATGPEHYEQAEELLAVAADYDQDGAKETGDRCRTEALVRALLANTAATAMQTAVDGSEPGMSPREFAEWHRVAGAKGATS